MHPYLHAQYVEPVDLAGQNMIGLLDRPREELLKAIPILRDPSIMDSREGTDAEVTTRDTGEIADEIHDS